MEEENLGEMAFTYQHHDGAPIISVVLHPDSSIVEVFESFEDFVRAVGFTFEGKVGIVIDEATKGN